MSGLRKDDRPYTEAEHDQFAKVREQLAELRRMNAENTRRLAEYVKRYLVRDDR